MASETKPRAVHGFTMTASAAAGPALPTGGGSTAHQSWDVPTDTASLPVFDLSPLLADPTSSESLQLAAAISDCLERTSALVVRDPRVPMSLNDAFLDQMEAYFAQPTEAKMADVRQELSYQVGATPGGVEKPRCLKDARILDAAAALDPAHRPVLPTGPDPKWRFFHRVGPRPAATQFAEQNAEPVVPAAFPKWTEIMDEWGSKLVAAVETVAAAAARGLGLPPDAFTSRMHLGPHLLAPTGSDLAAHGTVGTVLAGYHTDLNFLTIHGRSRYPGLFVWLRDGTRLPVRIPPGCLLLQAGKQMEWLTGGAIPAGYHEVVATPDTRASAERAAAEGRPTWRVSSTVFTQIASDATLQPLGRFATPEAAAAYPSMPAGQQVQQELALINLSGKAE